MSDWAVEKLQAVIDKHFEGKSAPRVLEAGCGSLTQVKLPQDAYTVGIDISQEQLDKNTVLNEKILGDIEQYELQNNDFDLIISWEVVEHLANPQLALDNMKGALRENGLLIVAAPNPTSMKGVVTRLTPHWFHVLVYKYIFKKADAGQPGCAPFPTIYARSMYPKAIRQFAEQHGFRVVFDEARDCFPRVFRESSPIWFGLYRFAAATLKLLSGGTLGGRENTDFIITLAKGT